MALESDTSDGYVLDEQIGFILRQAQQRHTTIFAECFNNDVTPTQWAAISKLVQIGECSQNLLGRHTAMDVATIQGVVDRLKKRNLLTSKPDPDDKRRVVLSVSKEGEELYRRHLASAKEATEATLGTLDAAEREQLKALLKKIA